MMKKFLLSVSALALTATAASAADIYTEPALVEAPVYIAEGFGWNGLYVGGSIGWAWHDRDDNGLDCGEELGDYGQELEDFDLADFLDADIDSLEPDQTCEVREAGFDGTDDTFHIFDLDDDDGDDGWMASLFVGVNRQYGNFVVGTELEGVWLDSTESSNEFFWVHQDDDSTSIEDDEILAAGFGAFETDGPDWMAQATIKGGWLFSPATLFYVKGGFAAADKQESRFDGEAIDQGDLCNGICLANAEFLGFEGDEDVESGYGFGGTLGVGVEHKFTQNFSLGLEYQGTFLNYNGDHEVTAVVEDFDTGEVRETTLRRDFDDIMIHAVKVKGTFHFN